MATQNNSGRGVAFYGTKSEYYRETGEGESKMSKPEVGSIGWVDLTVEDAGKLREFYKTVVGWNDEGVAMGEYNDYMMKAPASGTPVAGVCHKAGINADLPSHWLIYITVEDLDQSAQSVVALGGRLIVEPKEMGNYGRYCVFADPAGAVAALFEPA